MNLFCAHKIKTTTKYNDDVDQLHIDNVHFHWRFKKSSIEKTETHRQFEINELIDDSHVLVEMIEKENDELRISENDENSWIEYEQNELKRIIQESFDNTIERFENAISKVSFEVEFIVQNMKKNNHIEFSIEKHDFVENELVDDDLLDVNNSEKMKAKERFSRTKRKKSLMTKTQKKTIKSIRRNFSRFEHVKKRFQITRHQQDDVTQRSELKQERQNQREQRDRERESKERKNRERKENHREKEQKLHAFEEKKTQHQNVYTETRQRARDETREREIRDERQKIRKERISSNSISVFFFEITSIEISKLNENLNMSTESD